MNMKANQFITIMLALIPVLLVPKVQTFPAETSISVQYNHPRASRTTQDMENMQDQLTRKNASINVLSGIETIRRFFVEQQKLDLCINTSVSSLIPCVRENYRKIIESVTVLVSASYLLDSYKDSNSTKLTVLSVIIEEVVLDICDWLITFNTGLSCTNREEIILGICQWLSTFDTSLDCENREEFLVSFVAIGLNPSLLELDINSSVFGIDVDLPMSPSRNWIESSNATLEHRDFICNFLFGSPSCMG